MLDRIIIKQPDIADDVLTRFIHDLEEHSIHITPFLARLLLLRGIDTTEKAQEFLTPDLQALHDPFLMLGMDAAIHHIMESISRGDQITIYGDYDVDGVTSTTILLKTLQACNAKVNYYIPDRIEEGYGINIAAIQALANGGTKLLISVDTGITALEQVAFAKSLGLNVIITDHHECQETLPCADSILNPKQPECKYPFKLLAGVGVTYKLVQALAKRYSLDKEFILDLLEIVAVGTVADLVPLLGENRTMVYHAFLRMENMQNIGLKALFDVAGVDIAKRSAGVIGFQIGPRLNAAGRLGDAKRGVELFLTTDREKAFSIAEALNGENQKRRDMEEQIFSEADELIRNGLIQDNPKILVVAHEGWHHGVIGIVASRITQKYYRPTILLAIEEGVASGSARSVEDFSIFDALMSTKHVFIKFGGHEMAAGMSLSEDKIEELTQNINEYAREHMTEEVLIPKAKIEKELLLDEVTIDLIESLEQFEPFGMGNEEPRFLMMGKIDSMELMGKEKNHFKLRLTNEQISNLVTSSVSKSVSKPISRPIDAVSFYGSDYYDTLIEDMSVGVIGTLQINEWKSYKNPQIFIKEVIYEKTLEATLVKIKAYLQTMIDISCNSSSKALEVDPLQCLTRECCIAVYKNLKKLSVNGQSTLDIAKLLCLNPSEKQAELKDYEEIALILCVFLELKLIKLEVDGQGKIVFNVISTKKVELTQSTLYNKMCCQND